jgi:hypothetical protein
MVGSRVEGFGLTRQDDAMSHSFEIRRRIAAPAQDVWNALADHRGYRNWTPVTTSKLEQLGSPDPNGVGALRALGVGPVLAKELIVEFEPESFHLAYELVRGVPVTGYRADVYLTADGDATELLWRGRFQSAPPGMALMLNAFLRKVVADTAKGLDRHVATR